MVIRSVAVVVPRALQTVWFPETSAVTSCLWLYPVLLYLGATIVSGMSALGQCAVNIGNPLADCD